MLGLEMQADNLDLLLGLGKVLVEIGKRLLEQSRSDTDLTTEVERTFALAQRHIKVTYFWQSC